MSTNDTNLGYSWWIKIRNAPIISSQIPLEAALSYPVCAQGELRCFHYAVVSGHIKRPFTLIRAALPHMELIELLVDQDEKLYPGLPSELGEYEGSYDRDRHVELLNLVPALARIYLREPAGETGERYLQLLEQSIPRALRPFYEALNPQFFRWLYGTS